MENDCDRPQQIKTMNKSKLMKQQSESLSDAATCSASSDTPETDALADEIYARGIRVSEIRMLEHARDMERQRNKDRQRLDVLETVSCWIGISDDGCHPGAKWSAGGVYIHSVREVADSYLQNAKHALPQ